MLCARATAAHPCMALTSPPRCPPPSPHVAGSDAGAGSGCRELLPAGPQAVGWGRRSDSPADRTSGAAQCAPEPVTCAFEPGYAPVVDTLTCEVTAPEAKQRCGTRVAERHGRADRERRQNPKMGSHVQARDLHVQLYRDFPPLADQAHAGVLQGCTGGGRAGQGAQ